MMLPANHPHRFELNDEVHARPPEALTPPARISFLALTNPAGRGQGFEPVADLASRYGAPPPATGANHYSADFGPFRLKWERHTEFVRYKVIASGLGRGNDPFADPAIRLLPAEWLAALPGEVMVAAHAALVPETEIGAVGAGFEPEALSARYFAGHGLVGAIVAGGTGLAFTDFRIHRDGFSRVLVAHRSMTPRQSGRIVQRLLEIDTYRVMALLALPVARSLSPFLNARESELAEVTTALVNAGEADEPVLLDRLTRMQAAIESRHADNHYRFGAAAAYYDLVQRRITELRETRIEGLQTFGEFTERRLAPAMNTCRTTAERQDMLSERVARATHLLSTRVEVTRQRQNQAVLESMNRRAMLQLRLQETVEGLSIAAVTYYIVGLIGYAAKGLNAAGVAINPELAMGISIPVVVLLTALGVRRIRQMALGRKAGEA